MLTGTPSDPALLNVPASNFDEFVGYVYDHMKSDAFAGNTNVLMRSDANLNRFIDVQDVLGVISAARLGFRGEAEPSAANRLLTDTNGDGSVNFADAFTAISDLRGEGQPDANDLAEFTFDLFSNAAPFFDPTNGNPFDPNNNPGGRPTPVQETVINVGTPTNLTFGVRDLRQLPAADLGIASYYLDVNWDQFDFSIQQRQGTPERFGDEATDPINNFAVFNSEEASALATSGEVVGSLANPIGIRDFGSADFVNFLEFNGEFFFFADIVLEFDGGQVINNLTEFGVVQDSGANTIDVLAGLQLDDVFDVAGSLATNGNTGRGVPPEGELLNVFQDPADTIQDDQTFFGELSAQVRDADGSPLELTLSAVSNGTKGTATINNGGTLNDPSDDVIEYTPNAGETGQDTIVVDVVNGNSTTNVTVTISIGELNDPPMITAPATADVMEDIQATINGISVADPDSGAADITVTLATTNGVMSFVGTPGAGLTVTPSTGKNITITGPVGEISTLLSAGVNYLGDQDVNGTDQLILTANDGGNTGVGPTGTDDHTVAITIQAKNDAPVVTAPGNRQGIEGTVIDLSGFTVADVDLNGGDLTTTVSISPGGSGNVLNFAGSSGEALQFTGDLNATLNALSGLTMTTQVLSTGIFTVDVTVNDNGNTPAPAEEGSASISVDVQPARLPSMQNQKVNVNEDSTAGVTFQAFPGLRLSENATLVFDPNADFTQGTNGTVTYDNKGTADPSDDTFTYIPTTLNFNGEDSFTVTIDDTDADNNGAFTATVTVCVDAVNDAPTIPTAPASIATDEDISVDFNAGNTIAIDDVDAGETAGATLDVELSSPNGFFNLNGNGVGVTGDGTGTITYTGDIASLNAALLNTTFTPTLNFNGSTEITVNVNDKGNTGPTIEMENLTIPVTVDAVNDAPTANFPAPPPITVKNSPLVFENGDTITIDDVDAGNATVEAAFTISSPDGTAGTLDLPNLGGSGATIIAGANGSATFTLEGSVAEINAAIAALTYDPALDFVSDTVNLDLDLDDRGNTGKPGQSTASFQLTFEVLDFIPSTLQGFVFQDLDLDGVKDNDEPGIANVPVHLGGLSVTGETVDRTLHTDENGSYTFGVDALLAPPDANTAGYTISYTPPAFWVDGNETIGTQGGTNPFANEIFVPTSVFEDNQGRLLGGVTGEFNNFAVTSLDFNTLGAEMALQFVRASSLGINNGGRLLLAVDANGAGQTFINYGGWDGFSSFQIDNILPNQAGARLTAVNGVTRRGDLTEPDIRHLGEDSSGNLLYWVEGGPNLLPNTVQADGEGERAPQTSEEQALEMLAAAEGDGQRYREAADEIFANGDFA